MCGCLDSVSHLSVLLFHTQFLCCVAVTEVVVAQWLTFCLKKIVGPLNKTFNSSFMLELDPHSCISLIHLNTLLMMNLNLN